MILDADTLENIISGTPSVSYPTLEGDLFMEEELALEQLKATFPNLKSIDFDFPVANEYIAKFSALFPQLERLIITEMKDSDTDDTANDVVVTAIASLQNLRELQLWSFCNLTEDQIHVIIKSPSLPNLEKLYLWSSFIEQHETFLSLAQMPQLRQLSLKTTCENLQLLTSTTPQHHNNFPVLNEISVQVKETNDRVVRVERLKNHLALFRPALHFQCT